MKIKLPEIEIPESDPFLNDVLKRKENVVVLTQLVSTLTGPFVMAIDSEWGTGKTTFLRMWMQYLKNENRPFLFFNAWENDFSEDPLVSLIGEIESQISTLCTNGEIGTKSKEHIKKIKKIGSTLIKKGLPVALKLATYGILNIEKEYEEEISNLIESYAKDSIENYEKAKSNISTFKSRLSDLIKDVTSSEKNDSFPIIFFIDELDRCRPNYALELLEKIKHLFNIEGLVFILAIDKGQVGNSIKSLYGQGMKIDEYLRRFIDLDYRLPQPDKKVYCSILPDRFGITDVITKRTTTNARYELDQFVNIFSELADIFNFSLRTQEQCFSQFCIVLRTTPPNSKLYPRLLAGLICIKASSPALYRGFVAGEHGASELVSYIGQSQAGKTFLYHPEGKILEALLMTSNCKRGDIQKLIATYEEKKNERKTPEDERDRIPSIIKLFSDVTRDDEYGVFDYLSKKIEISDQFSID